MDVLQGRSRPQAGEEIADRIVRLLRVMDVAGGNKRDGKDISQLRKEPVQTPSPRQVGRGEL